MDITYEILATLKDLFPDVSHRYRNNQEQGFKGNSFYIRQVRVSNQAQLVNRSRRSYAYVLHYFPLEYPEGKAQRHEEQCERMAERLYSDFLYLKDYGGKVIETYHDIQDGVLLFHFDLRFRVKKPTEPNPMLALEERSGLKDG